MEPQRRGRTLHARSYVHRQMYHTEDILYHNETYEKALRALEMGRAARENCDIVTGERAPQIVQLAGDDPEQFVQAARRFLPIADAIDLNLGCPQARARDGHYGGYLLKRREWPLIERIVQALCKSCDVPITTKIRLCDTASDTYELGRRLALAGSSVITLHARHVAPNRRRAGMAKLEHVRGLVDALGAERRTRVLSNGNVRSWADIPTNMAYTHADGVMVGEPLLLNPDLFAPSAACSHHQHYPAQCALSDSQCQWSGSPIVTYLSMCERYPIDAPMSCVQQHIQSMMRGLPPSRETRALHDALREAGDVQTMLHLARSSSVLQLQAGAVHKDDPK